MNPMHCHQQKATEDAFLLQKTATNAQEAEGNTSLHLACHEDRVKEARWLVTQGASTHMGDEEEKTPLQVVRGGLGQYSSRQWKVE